MQIKKEIIERAKKNGVMDYASMLLSAAYLLNSEAYMLISEAQDMLGRNGLAMGTLKHLHNMYEKASNRYFMDFASLIKESGKKMEYFQDLDDFDRVFKKWAKIQSYEEIEKGEAECE